MEDVCKIVNSEYDRREAIKRMAEFQKQQIEEKQQKARHKLMDSLIQTATSFGLAVLGIAWYNLDLIAMPIAFSMFCAGLIFTGMDFGKVLKWSKRV